MNLLCPTIYNESFYHVWFHAKLAKMNSAYTHFIGRKTCNLGHCNFGPGDFGPSLVRLG